MQTDFAAFWCVFYGVTPRLDRISLNKSASVLGLDWSAWATQRLDVCLCRLQITRVLLRFLPVIELGYLFNIGDHITAF